MHLCVEGRDVTDKASFIIWFVHFFFKINKDNAEPRQIWPLMFGPSCSLLKPDYSGRIMSIPCSLDIGSLRRQIIRDYDID